MTPRPGSIVLDAEALSLLAASDPAMQVWATVAARTGSTLYVSALTLAEVTDGSRRDANVRRIVKATEVVPVTAEIAYLAGALRADRGASRRKPRDLTVDAVVVATAMAVPQPVVVLTGDVGDFTRLAEGTSVLVRGIGAESRTS